MQAIAQLRGEEVAAQRRAAALRQVDLAASLGVDASRVSEWERGDLQPLPRHVLALAQALGVAPLSLLVCDPDDPPLTALRLAAGLRLVDVVERTGIPYGTYRRLEAGLNRRGPGPATVETLATVFAVTAEAVQRAAARQLADIDRQRQVL